MWTSFFRKIKASHTREDSFALTDENKGGTGTKIKDKINEAVTAFAKNFGKIEKDQ